MDTFNGLICSLLLALSLVSGSSAREPDDEKTVGKFIKEDVPTWKLSRTQIQNMGANSIGELIVLLQAKLPVPQPEGQTTMGQIAAQVSGTDNEIIHFHHDFLVVRSAGALDSTGEKLPVLLVKYLFEDGLLVRGPVILNPAVIKDIKLSAKKLK